MSGLGDYLCSQNETGPWVAVFASSYEEAATQYARAQDLPPGEIVYIGVPAPTPDLFDADQLVQYIKDRLGIEACYELREMAQGLAGEANYRVQRFAHDKAALVGRAMKVRAITLDESMVSVRFSLALREGA